MLNDISSFANLTIRTLYLEIAIAIIGLISDFSQFQLLNSVSSGVYENENELTSLADSNDSRQQIIMISLLVAIVVSRALFFRWVYLVNAKTRENGVQGMEFTPGWAVGWFFVPIASLWKPYEVMEEIWKTNSNPKNWHDEITPTYFSLWWFLWIMTLIVSKISSHLYSKANVITDFITANLFAILADCFEVALCVLIIKMVTDITKLHELNFCCEQNL
jgi:Domain of unknown function (DUF4328)